MTGRAFASRHGERVDAKQELLALGAANLGARAAARFPGQQQRQPHRDRDAVAAGPSSPASSPWLCTVAGPRLRGPLLAAFPWRPSGRSSCTPPCGLVDVAEFVRLRAFPAQGVPDRPCHRGRRAGGRRAPGVLVAIGLSVLDLLRRVARPHDAIEGDVPDLAGMHDVDDYPDADRFPGLLVYRYDSPLFFANAEDFRRRALAAVDETSGPVQWFLLNAEAIIDIDITAVDALEDLRRELTERDIVFAMAQIKKELRADLERRRPAGEDRRGPLLPHPAHGCPGVPSVAGPRGLTPGCSTGVVCDGSAPGSHHLRRVSGLTYHPTGQSLERHICNSLIIFTSVTRVLKFPAYSGAVDSRQFGH